MKALYLAGALGAAAASPAFAQSMPPMPGMAMPSESSSHPMTMGDGLSSPGSGTSRLPGNEPMAGLHWMTGDWMLMAHGYAWASWT
ncbi:MAG TPA: hypothetical protein VFL92_05055, partial [Sphingomonas sp.]|nr:hypothetical protein [Sphingomonas sp.]